MDLSNQCHVITTEQLSPSADFFSHSVNVHNRIISEISGLSIPSQFRSHSASDIFRVFTTRPGINCCQGPFIRPTGCHPTINCSLLIKFLLQKSNGFLEFLILLTQFSEIVKKNKKLKEPVRFLEKEL